MLLAIDVGNTNIVLGVYAAKELVIDWRISTNVQKTSDEYGITIHQLFNYAGIDPRAIKAVAISSVVPPINPALERMARKYFHTEPLVVGPGIKTGINIRYDNPREVGADRIVNAVAAYEIYGGPVIIVDFGTATTFCVVNAHGDYLGGVIAPGIIISTEALFQRASKLPRIELVKPKTVIGKNTISSMQSGIIYGFVGQVDEIIKRIKQELGLNPFVVATGGLAELIRSESTQIQEINPLLTLEGLRIIYERNKH